MRHPDTLLSMSNLAGVLRSQEKYEAVVEMIRRTLAENERVQGVNHPATLMTLDNLGYTLACQRKYEQGEGVDTTCTGGNGKGDGSGSPLNIEERIFAC